MEKCCIYIYHQNFPLKAYEIKAFSSCFKKYWIHYYILSDGFLEQETDISQQLKKHWIILYKYTRESEICNVIQKIKKHYEILYIDSFHEEFVEKIHSLRQSLDIPITNDYKIFSYKNLQRTLLNKKSSLAVSSLLFQKEEICFEKLEKQFSLPFIIKPNKGVESSGVYLIHEKKELDDYLIKDNSHTDYLSNTLLIEDYIEGDFYSIDYYVDENWEIFSTPPIYVKTAQDIKINDFLWLARFTGIKGFDTSCLEKLQCFIKDTVETCDIKNTFIHHEFKHIWNGVFKTIEINGRIWWRRIHMLQESYNINPLSLIIEKKDLIQQNIQNYFCCIAIYPHKTWTYKDYNAKLLHSIGQLPSFHSIDFSPNIYIWKTVWLSKDYYWNLGNIYLKHVSKDQLLNDYAFIEENYKKLIILDS